LYGFIGIQHESFKNNGNTALITQPLITQIRAASNFVRVTASVVLVTFTMLVCAPAVAAVRTVPGQNAKAAVREPSDEAKFAQLVQQIEDQLSSWDKKAARGQNGFAESAALNGLRARLDQSAATILDKFANQRQQILDKGLAKVILKRHDDFVAKYQSNLDRLRQYLDTVLNSPDDETLKQTLGKATAWLASQQKKRSQQPFDPNNLPVKSRRPDPDNKPRLYREEFYQSGLFDSPMPKLAALGDFTFDNLAGANDPAYLAETDEVNLNQFIQDKAAELDHDPVKIYHWVRNNVEWLPTWGAVQDAELTLSAKRGNAFDIASLTIALLRASGIPSRYVHGTIDVPLEEFKNWAGGFDTAEAAANYAASGGIPLSIITSVGPNGETTQTIRMEHVWVEAAIDYVPSRGARNYDADEWVQLDPSYKQYTYVQGVDVYQISGIDVAQLSDAITNSGVFNQEEGWVSNLDATIVDNAREQAQLGLSEYISNNLSNGKISDLLGGAKAILKEYPVLPAALSNDVVVAGVRYDKIPSALQQRVSYSFEVDIFGDPISPTSFSWSSLNNEKLTLSFRPATAADEEALLALIPDSITDIGQFPQSLSTNLVYLVPELRLNGQVVKTGSALRPGEELDFTTKIQFVGGSRNEPPRTYKVIAGSFLSVNAIAGSVSPAKLEELKTRLEQAKTIMESNDQALINTLTMQDVMGDVFYAGTLGYYAQLLSFSQITGFAFGTLQYLAAGTGTIGYEPGVTYFFGFPQSIEEGSVVFDIPIITSNQALNGDADKRKQYQLQVGLISSALEHLTPEQMFANADPNAPPPDAISAVKALQKANAGGQRIYHINQQNRTLALQNIHLDSQAMTEINSALDSGKEIVTHTDPVSVPGWSGAGYIIYDSATGEGAYKISGGANGGVFVGGVGILGIFLVAMAGVMSGAVVVAPFLLALVLSLALHLIILELIFNDDLDISATSDQLLAIAGTVVSAIGFIVSAPITAFIMAVLSIVFTVWSLL
jgi:transglutaminase-like putative cysteine protease